MSREEFLGELEGLLADVPEDERKDALSYYYDYLDGADADEISERIAGLGTPKELADKIKLASDDTNVIEGEFTETGYSDRIDDTRDVPDKYTQVAEHDDNVSGEPEKKYNIFGLTITKSVLILIIILLVFIIPMIFSVLRGIGHIGRGIANGILGPVSITGEVISDIKDAFGGAANNGSIIAKESGNTVSSDGNLSKIDLGSAANIKKWDIDAGAVDFAIKESSDGNIYVEYDDRLKNEIKADSDTLKVKTENKKTATFDKRKVIVYVPDDMKLKDVDINAGAGLLVCEVSFEANDIDIELGAGEMQFDRVKTDKADIDLGAGKISFSEFIAKNADIKVAMGDLALSGDITGNLSLDCGMGNAALNLSSKESDHNYDYEVGMGNLSAGTVEISGIAGSREIDNNASSNYDVEVGMGNVSIAFKD